MIKAFRLGHPLDKKQNRIEILDEDLDVSAAIEDIEPDDDEPDDEPMILIEDDDDTEGVALSQADLQEIWPYLEAFLKHGTIGEAKFSLDRAESITSYQQDGKPYLRIKFGSTEYEIFIDEAEKNCTDIAKEALEQATKTESAPEAITELTMQLGVATITSTNADKWKKLAEAVRTPTSPPADSSTAESYY